MCGLRLVVRTPGFHPGNRGSIPLGRTIYSFRTIIWNCGIFFGKYNVNILIELWVDVRTAKGPVLKTGEIARCLGSNPSSPAIENWYILEKWQRGRMRSPAKGVSGLKLGSRVQIPPSPPFFFNKKIVRSRRLSINGR